METETARGYSCEELIAIYQRAGSVELPALEAAAAELYPGRMDGDAPANIQVETGNHGRWFRREAGKGKEPVYEAPKYTIKSRLNWVGVMEDGCVLAY
ncbi:MAG: hypothetical protein LUF28_07640 [Clostridiales bacterium]|nr:hypothetical protein [Clostridiales bacterium]